MRVVVRQVTDVEYSVSAVASCSVSTITAEEVVVHGRVIATGNVSTSTVYAKMLLHVGECPQ